MNTLAHKLHNMAQRKQRVRARVSGTTQRPRLSVHISNQHITAQIIDDTVHTTLAYATTVAQKDASGTMTDKAARIGTEIAQKAQKIKVSSVVFDRGSHRYHGRVAALADAARKQGLEF